MGGAGVSNDWCIIETRVEVWGSLGTTNKQPGQVAQCLAQAAIKQIEKISKRNA